MPLKRIFLVALILLLPALAPWAQAEVNDPLDLTLREQDSNSQFMIGVEVTQLSLAQASLSGAGLRLGYEYGFSQNWSVLPAVALVSGLSGSQGYLYSSIDASVRYSLFGSLHESKREVLRAGAPIISQKSDKANRMTLSLGLEQLFLNGASAIYPAEGPTVGVSYAFTLFHQWSEVSLRGADLTSGSRSITAIFIDFSLLFGN
jgi:hypothetical protein